MANRTLANIDIPRPFDNLDTLISRFAKKGLSAKDMVVLSGILRKSKQFIYVEFNFYALQLDHLYGNYKYIN